MSVNSGLPQNVANTQQSAYQSMRHVVRFGVGVALAFFGGLVGWAAVAPLDSAALAPGVLSVEGTRKTIQHLEGGLIQQIHVRDGDHVKVGQALVSLDDTQVKASLVQLRGRYHAALALQARLLAERDGDGAIEFPTSLFKSAPSAELAEVLGGEQRIFTARQEALASRRAILRQGIAQLEQEIHGLRGQISAENRQLDLIAEERDAEEKMVVQKLTGMQRLLALKRDAAEIEGARNRNTAAIARAQQSIAEENLRILELDTQRDNEVATELRETQTQVFDLAERIRAAQDVLRRTVIRSPLDGIIVDKQVHTISGVVAPGEALMDIVPADERLIVEAQVAPEDIDAVYSGLSAQVTLTAFSRRNIAPLDGEVIHVSADRLTDERNGQAYFLARIELPEKRGGAYRSLDLYPGMQAEVMIVTGERTALEYFYRPVARTFDRALREQ